MTELVTDQVPKTMTGIKYDVEKPDLSLLPRAAKEEIAKAFMFGQKKYGRYNYLGGMDWTRLLAAAERHITAFNDGEDLDPETGINHLGHAGACICMLLEYIKNERGNDNRYKGDNDVD